MHRARRQFAVSAAVLSALAGTTAWAGTFEWNSTTSGTWSDAAKWSLLAGSGSAPPGAGDAAIFSKNHVVGNAYRIALNGNVTLDALTATSSDAMLGSAVGGPMRTLTLSGANADLTVNGADAELRISDYLNDPGMNINVGDATTVSNGATLWMHRGSLATNRLLLGTTGGTVSNPSAVVVAADATLGVTTNQFTAIGTAGHGKLTVNGTAMFSGELRIGRSGLAGMGGAVETKNGTLFAPSISIGGGAGSGSIGSLFAGLSSEVMVTDSLTIGGAEGTGQGFVTISGSRFLSPQGSTTINRTGKLELNSTKDSYIRSHLNVNGGSLSFYGTHQNLQFAPGVSITVQPEGLLMITSTMGLPQSTTTIQSGAWYIHNDASGGARETVTIPAGGTLTLNGTASFNSDTVVRGTLNFNPTSVSNHKTASFDVAGAGYFNAQVQWAPLTGGTLRVGGEGALYRDFTAGSFAFGATQGFSASDRARLVVQPGGTFQKDDGIIDIGRFGAMEVAGGTVIADDIVRSHADGQFNFTAGTIIIDNALPIGSWSPMPGDMNLGHGQKLQTLSTATIETGRLLHLGGGELRAHSIANNGSMQLDAGTLALSGGSYTGPAVTVGANAVLTGVGTFAGRISGNVGSRVIAEGDLTLGDPGNAAGFATTGDIDTRAHTVTLRDSNAAVLGSVTQIGAGASAGTLAAVNGLVLNTGASMTGHGTVNTPDDPARPFIVDGSVSGNSGLQPLTLSGHVKGNGHLGNVTIAGTYAPGHNGPAEVHVGDLVFAPTGTLKIDVGGPNPAAGFDRIDALGHGVQLGGTLDLQLINNYQPALYVPHEIIAADAVVGRFDSILGMVVSPGVALAVMYEEESVRVTAALPGDANLDGQVNLTDFNRLAANFGALTGASWTSGDFTGDGIVNLNDFNRLAANFGLSASGPNVTPDDWAALGAAVPEPMGAGALLGLGLALATRRRRR